MRRARILTSEDGRSRWVVVRLGSTDDSERSALSDKNSTDALEAALVNLVERVEALEYMTRRTCAACATARRTNFELAEHRAHEPFIDPKSPWAPTSHYSCPFHPEEK